MNANLRLHIYKFSLTCDANNIFKFSDEETQETFSNQQSEDHSESFPYPLDDQKEEMLTGISSINPIVNSEVAGKQIFFKY